MTLSFDGVYDLLTSAGYDVTKEPEEAKPIGKIEMKYDMRTEVEDVSMTSYRVDHMIDLNWVSDDPGTIATQIITLMTTLGKEYCIEPYFVMDQKPLQRANGAMYRIELAIRWVQWVTVNI